MENCEYELIREDRYDDALQFTAKHDFPDDPLCMIMDEETREMFRDVFEHNLSLALVSTSTREIIGLRVIKIGRKDYSPIDFEKIQSEGTRKLFEFDTYKDEYFDVFAHYSVEEAFEFYGLSVHIDYRRKGIGLKLMKAALLFISSMGTGPVLVKGDCDSNYSKCIYERLGFDCLAELTFDDYNKAKGENIIIDTGKHKSFKMYGKIIL